MNAFIKLYTEAIVVSYLHRIVNWYLGSVSNFVAYAPNLNKAYNAQKLSVVIIFIVRVWSA